MDTQNYNVMVYVRTNKKFEALQSLQKFIIAPNLMYAVLIPYNKLDKLKEWADERKDLFEKYNYSLQLRSAKDRKTVLYQIN